MLLKFVLFVDLILKHYFETYMYMCTVHVHVHVCTVYNVRKLILHTNNNCFVFISHSLSIVVNNDFLKSYSKLRTRTIQLWLVLLANTMKFKLI